MKKRVKLELNSPTLEAGFKVMILDFVDDLGLNDSMVLSNLQEPWRLLGQNLMTMKEIQEGTRDALKNLSKGSSDKISRVDLELWKLDNRLGKCNEEAGTLLVFDMIGVLWEDTRQVDKLEETFNAKGLSWEANLVKKCSEAAKSSAGGDASITWESNFMGKLKTELTPVFKLFMQMSSAPYKPGDI
mmetsp:Transcript_5656/g.8690  ORF Transcript_5656/g.8690 Transcript_5656/m.8690 type:complete len:187 (-) Transcript_5656:539-1099(-)